MYIKNKRRTFNRIRKRSARADYAVPGKHCFFKTAPSTFGRKDEKAELAEKRDKAERVFTRYLLRDIA